ncbi:hypothetical protein, variant [Aphanomyces invadans]|nr:hypothetical protein, variant [Aphanomyces invadans]ETW10010.1 hypothetical protein, variant [Aphanomyces invadans]|eukprot:XP_008861421.1 hypothetical protein, variant [Aphanomyces invadans]
MATVSMDNQIPTLADGMHHFFVDACSTTCSSPNGCLNDKSLPPIRVTATMLYAMCDGQSPRTCSGGRMNHLLAIYMSYMVVWIVVGIVWTIHVFRSCAPIFKLHVTMSLALVTKVVAMTTTSAVLLVSPMNDILAHLNMAVTMQFAASCLMMVTVFGLADGCEIVGTHGRRFTLAILYIGYSFVETAEPWNPILSAVMVACALLTITKLSTTRLRELRGYAYVMQLTGRSPDASPLGTKVHLLRATRTYSILYFLETYCVKIIFFLLNRSSSGAEDVMVEAIQLCYVLVMGYTFRCRHFTYVVTSSRLQRLSSTVVPIICLPQTSEVAPPATKLTVFLHPDNSQSFGKLGQGPCCRPVQ